MALERYSLWFFLWFPRFPPLAWIYPESIIDYITDNVVRKTKAHKSLNLVKSDDSILNEKMFNERLGTAQKEKARNYPFIVSLKTNWNYYEKLFMPRNHNGEKSA